MMPSRGSDRPNRLRSYESAPIPQFAIDMLREFNRTISEEMSPVRENIEGIKNDLSNLRLELNGYGQRLGTIEQSLSAIKTSFKASVRTAGWMVAGIVILIALAANAVQLYDHFFPKAK
jgi:hypothetical protein